MRIGLIDVDGHNFPNIALMRISAYHKARGDTVEWWWSDFVHYDIVYMSKIFSGTYTEDLPEPLNADRVIKGGTGYCIHLGDDGKEHFDKSKNTELPPEIEHCFQDYSIYPQFPFAVSMTSPMHRGRYAGYSVGATTRLFLNHAKNLRIIRGKQKMNKSKIIALVAVAILLWLVLSVSISLLLAMTAFCIKIMGAPAAIACFAASILFVIFCCLMCSEEDEDAEK